MKTLTVVLYLLMFWSVIGEKFVQIEPSYNEELLRLKSGTNRTVPGKSRPDRPLFDGLFKPEDRCDCPRSTASKAIRGCDFNMSNGAMVLDDCGYPVVSKLANGIWLAYFNVDFGKGAKIVRLRISSGSTASEFPSVIKIYLDHPWTINRPFVQFSVQSTGGWCKFVELTVFATDIPEGVHNMYILTTGDPRSDVGIFSLDWFVFVNDAND